MKSCTKCQSSSNGFFKDSRLKSGFKSVCKVCDVNYKRSETAIMNGRMAQRGKIAKNKKANDAKYRSSDKGLLVAKNQKYKRRSLIGQGKINIDDWLLLLNKFNNQCAYCQQSGEITIDHIIPISQGGLNVIQNVLPCCRSCNSKKQCKSFESFCDTNTQNRIHSTLRL